MFHFLGWSFCSSLSLQVFHLCLVIWTTLMCPVVSTLLARPCAPFVPHQIVACLLVFTFLSDFWEFLVFLVFVHIVRFLDFALSLDFCLCSLWICLSILDWLAGFDPVNFWICLGLNNYHWITPLCLFVVCIWAQKIATVFMHGESFRKSVEKWYFSYLGPPLSGSCYAWVTLAHTTDANCITDQVRSVLWQLHS